MGDKVEEMGEGMQCSDHPYRNNTGGICAFCLQDKLGKLVSSSKTNTFFYPIGGGGGGGAPSSSSSSPSFQSEVGPTSSAPPSVSHLVRPNQIPLFAHKKKKVMSSDANLILKRSRSVAVPRHLSSSDGSDDSPRKKSFWSFLHLSRRRSIREADANKQQQNGCGGGGGGGGVVVIRKDRGSSEMKRDCLDENESPNSSHASSAASSSFGRKVARSRSVGCGSRSFSGDFLERISTGFGDCALRRVESQRENKPKIVLHRVRAAAAADNNNDDDERINKERVKCGGIFGGFGMMSSSSSSSSSSLWLSDDFNGRLSGGGPVSTPHGRSRSWGWAFASPMRAFRPSSTTKSYIAAAVASSDHRGDNGRRDIIINSNSNTSSNVHINATTASSSSSRTTTTATNDDNSSSSNHIGASPSLLAVRG